MLGRLLQHLLTVLETEKRLRLLRIADHGDDDLVEVPRGTLDDVQVAEGHRIKRSRAEGGRHAVSPSQMNRKIKSVSPKVRSQPVESPGGTTTAWRTGRSTLTIAPSASHPGAVSAASRAVMSASGVS
jgi:hypothetical protein